MVRNRPRIVIWVVSGYLNPSFFGLGLDNSNQKYMHFRGLKTVSIAI